MKNSNDIIGNRTRDLPTAPPRAPIDFMAEKFCTDVVPTYNSKFLEHGWKDGRKSEIVAFCVKS